MSRAAWGRAALGIVAVLAGVAIPAGTVAARTVAAGTVAARTVAARTVAASGKTGSHVASLTPTELAAGADHDCVVPGSGRPRVDWSALHNPVLSYPDAGAKDEALVWDRGRWHMLFSYMTHDSRAPGGVYWDVATATSTDLVHWSAPAPWPAQPGTLGVASPDIVREPSGQFVVTYQSNPPASGQDKIYYRTSADLVHWSPPHPLAHDLAPHLDQRQLDGALAFTGHGVIVGYKASTGNGAQHFVVAWSPSGSLAGPWRLIGRPDITLYDNTVENYEFVSAGHHWQLIATSNILTQPWIFELDGNPDTPTSWLHWNGGRQLSVPIQPWDHGSGISGVGYEEANAAFLCNARAADGYYYLLYAGSSTLTEFGGWGHASIGIARSTDLIHWQVPPPAR